jgi:hypothetical protein
MTDSEPDTDPADPDESNSEQDADPTPVELTTGPESDQSDERQTEHEYDRESGLSEADQDREQNATVSREKLVGYMFWAAFGLLGLLTAVALFGFYTSVTRVINIWITDQYQPIFNAVFNLVVVLACLVGLSLLVRLLRDGEDEPTVE